MIQPHKTIQDVKTLDEGHIRQLARDIHQDGVAVMYNQNLKEHLVQIKQNHLS